MATPFSEVYDFFLSKVSDYSFIRLNRTGDLESILFKNLRSSIVRFTNCIKDLSYNELSGEFNSDLDLDEKEVLSTLMVLEYIGTKILDVKNMEQIMTEVEFVRYSQANHLDKLINLRKEMQSEVSKLLNEYSLKHWMDELS